VAADQFSGSAVATARTAVVLVGSTVVVVAAVAGSRVVVVVVLGLAVADNTAPLHQ
jgi:hypothetical protein